MTEQDRPDEAGLSPDEVAEQRGEALPDREAMSLIDANIAIPIDATVAADVLSDESIAPAEAEEDAESEQAT